MVIEGVWNQGIRWLVSPSISTMGLATLIFWKAMVCDLPPSERSNQREDRKWRVQREARKIEAQKNGEMESCCRWKEPAVSGAFFILEKKHFFFFPCFLYYPLVRLLFTQLPCVSSNFSYKIVFFQFFFLYFFWKIIF